ncbi:hypothetical protein [Vulcanisaeta souniana]|uniref:hypothetical protein n=1 Tax=Vulcanisaeta souniana TaxID=164452 RepID=UPI001FB3CB50|nr:hypothetical protein [Vulcanisaeta souniana]
MSICRKVSKYPTLLLTSGDYGEWVREFWRELNPPGREVNRGREIAKALEFPGIRVGEDDVRRLIRELDNGKIPPNLGFRVMAILCPCEDPLLMNYSPSDYESNCREWRMKHEA